MSSIREIARFSGVSPRTVSNILHGRTAVIKPGTRERVLNAMRELNYAPRPLLPRPSAVTLKTIGVAFTHVDAYVMPILEGILAHLEMSAWSLMTVNHRDWEDVHQSLRIYCDGRVAGLIVVDPSTHLRLPTALEDRNLPFIIVNDETGDPSAWTVGVDVESAAQLAVNHLLDLGHRRIAMLRGVWEPVHLDRRYNGFLKAMSGRHVPVVLEWVSVGEYRTESGYIRTRDLLRLPEASRPTALFCANDYIAAGALQALQEAEIPVPQAISVVGFDDTSECLRCSPTLTTVRRPLKEIGAEAANLLTARIEFAVARLRDGSVPVRRELPAQLIVRESTGPAPHA